MKNKNVIIKKSKIDGANKGLFANQYFKKNQLIGQAHENGQPVGNIGHMHNHSDNPNMYSIKKGNKRFVFAKNNIQAGEELTTNYRLQPELEQPEDFAKGGLVKMPKPSKQGLASKKFSRSLEVTNRLFTENYIFSKPKSRKNKIYDPNAKYYQDGGDLPQNVGITYLSEDDRSHYSPLDDTIYLNPNASDSELNHELVHAWQNRTGRLRTNPNLPQQRPPIVASDDQAASYYTRKGDDVDYYLNNLSTLYPNLTGGNIWTEDINRFIPEQIKYDKVIDPLMYLDPNTMEGEAEMFSQVYGPPPGISFRKKGGESNVKFISSKDGVETPIYKQVEIKPSKIHGKGLFTKELIKKNEPIGICHVKNKDGQLIPSTILGMYNHNKKTPNVYEINKGDHVVLMPLRNINPGEELTADYDMVPIEGLQDSSSFRDGGESCPEGFIYYSGQCVEWQEPEVIETDKNTGYNAATGQINRNTRPGSIENNAWWKEHEDFHHLQNLAGAMNTAGFLGQRPNNTVASDQAIGNYYNRRNSELEAQTDAMIKDDPNLQFIPRNKLQDFTEGFIGANAIMYQDPNTLEGEARVREEQYEEDGKSMFPKKQDGGNKDAMTGMMKARLAYANEFGNPAAKRMINLPDNPYQFDNGDTGTHYMASMDNYAIPQIQDENGVLQLGDYGPESNEAIRFDSDEDANYFAENYKNVSPGFLNQKQYGGLHKFAPGGITDWPPKSKNKTYLNFSPFYGNSFTGTSSNMRYAPNPFTDEQASFLKVNTVNSPQYTLGIAGGHDPRNDSRDGDSFLKKLSYEGYVGLPYNYYPYNTENHTNSPSFGFKTRYNNTINNKMLGMKFNKLYAELAGEYSQSDGYNLALGIGPRFDGTAKGNRRLYGYFEPRIGVSANMGPHHLKKDAFNVEGAIPLPYDEYNGAGQSQDIIDYEVLTGHKNQTGMADIDLGLRAGFEWSPKWLTNKLGRDSKIYGDIRYASQPIRGMFIEDHSENSLLQGVSQYGNQNSSGYNQIYDHGQTDKMSWAHQFTGGLGLKVPLNVVKDKIKNIKLTDGISKYCTCNDGNKVLRNEDLSCPCDDFNEVPPCDACPDGTIPQRDENGNCLPCIVEATGYARHPRWLKNGGTTNDYIEADLDEEEIEQYKKGGYIVEELDDYQDGGIYKVKGSSANYKKVNGKWQVDWNRSGKYQPLSKGDVKTRSANLDKYAKPVYTPEPKIDPYAKINSNVSDNTKVNNIYQKPLDWEFTPEARKLNKKDIVSYIKKDNEIENQRYLKQLEDSMPKTGMVNNEGIKETVGQYNRRKEKYDDLNFLQRMIESDPADNYKIQPVGDSPFIDSPMTGIGGAPKIILKAGKWLKPLWTGSKNATQPFRQATVSAFKAPLPLGKTITNATAGKLNLGNTLGAYFGAEGIYNQFNPNSDVVRSQGDFVKNPSWNSAADAAFETGVNSLNFLGLGLGKQVIKPGINKIKDLGKSINTSKQLPGSSVASSVDDVGRSLTQAPKPAWQMEELPGLHLKSTMTDGAISKIVEPKTGLINVEQALGIIGKESGGADKVALIRQGLGENIPKKMDFNEFRKITQDQLIPLEKQFATHSSDYGIGRLGFVPKVQGNAFERFQIIMNTAVSDLNKPRLLENQTLILGNKSKFGKGSSAHGNPDETLGHIHFLRDAETPDVLTVTQIQSDAFQGTHRVMPKIFDKEKELRSLSGMERIAVRQEELAKTAKQIDANTWQLSDGSLVDKSVIEHLGKGQSKINAMKKAEIENFTQKSLLDKNHQERYLQELVNYAGERGDINKLRLPTPETAAKVQGYHPGTTSYQVIEEYNKVLNTPEYDRMMANLSEADKVRLQKILKGEIKGNIYDLDKETILKKYSEQPKTIKKLFGVEPEVVTDYKGNTWYEFGIPKKFKEGKGEIKALSAVGVVGTGAALHEKKQGGFIELELDEDEIEQYRDNGYIVEELY